MTQPGRFDQNSISLPLILPFDSLTEQFGWGIGKIAGALK